MKNKSQEERIISKLNKTGFVTRNEALKNYISRLGAIICDLQKDGWKFKAEFIKTPYGKDFKYTVIESPIKREVFTLPDGREITRYK